MLDSYRRTITYRCIEINHLRVLKGGEISRDCSCYYDF